MSTEQFIAFVAARLAERLEQKLQQIAEGKVKAQKRLLSVREAAIYLGRTENAVQHLVHKRAIPVVRIGKRVQFDRLQLDKWIERKQKR